jgi:hypothetical protein
MSIYNPLKVLHKHLENPKYPVIGISNWSLDASKMNRALHISRNTPSKEDLHNILTTFTKYHNTDKLLDFTCII